MKFFYQTKASTFFYNGCVQGEADRWAAGKRAYVVTGKTSGRASGALEDVEKALASRGIAYKTFEGIANNPTVEQCRSCGKEAREFQADFIVAIGGGSPIDAAKAVAVFAYEDIETDRLYQNAFTGILPVVAIPTTSGTGSEVTPWSVLTRLDLNTKRSFGDIRTIPAFALLDSAYTNSLPDKITLDTAMDACTHCMESVIGKKATPITDALNLEGLRHFAPCLSKIEQGEYTSIRDELMLVSLLGGMGIAHTGTTLMHGMGYPLTYYKGLAHGEANCAVMPGYLRFVERVAPKRLKTALDALETDIETLIKYVKRNFSLSIELTRDEIRHYSEQTMAQGSTRNIDYDITMEEIEHIYHESLSEYIQ